MVNSLRHLPPYPSSEPRARARAERRAGAGYRAVSPGTDLATAPKPLAQRHRTGKRLSGRPIPSTKRAADAHQRARACFRRERRERTPAVRELPPRHTAATDEGQRAVLAAHASSRMKGRSSAARDAPGAEDQRLDRDSRPGWPPQRPRTSRASLSDGPVLTQISPERTPRSSFNVRADEVACSDRLADVAHRASRTRDSIATRASSRPHSRRLQVSRGFETIRFDEVGVVAPGELAGVSDVIQPTKRGEFPPDAARRSHTVCVVAIREQPQRKTKPGRAAGVLSADEPGYGTRRTCAALARHRTVSSASVYESDVTGHQLRLLAIGACGGVAPASNSPFEGVTDVERP